MPGFAPPHSPAKIWWSWRRDLNPRPSDYKSDALPAELRQRCSNQARITDRAQTMQEMDSKLLRGATAALVEKEALSVHPLQHNNLFFICYLHALPQGPLPGNPQLSTPPCRPPRFGANS